MKVEQLICAEAIRKLRDDGFLLEDIHEEVVVVLDGQTISADIIAIKDGEITVIEAKDHLNDALVRQALRWQGLADWIIAISLEPRSTSATHTQRRTTLRRYGVGIYYVGATTMTMVPLMRGDVNTAVVPPRKQEKVNHDLILSSLVSVRGPAAGSAGVKRVRPDKWDKIRDVLRTSSPATLSWLKVEVGPFTPSEWREFQKAVTNGEVPGITKIPYSTPVQYTMGDEP